MFDHTSERDIYFFVFSTVMDDPQCELKPMPNADKAFIWACMDFSDGEATAEKFAVRLRSVDDAAAFKEKWTAAKLFNNKARNGDEDLVWAEAIEDAEEVVDDIETNTTAAGGED